MWPIFSYLVATANIPEHEFQVFGKLVIENYLEVNDICQGTS